MVNIAAQELGRIIGQGLKTANSYTETFVETGEVTEILLANLENVNLIETVKVKKNFYAGCAQIPFVLDHPVYGLLDSSTLYIDGGYCSTSTVFEFNVPEVSEFPFTFPIIF